jgi:transcription elongation factor Elf1
MEEIEKFFNCPHCREEISMLLDPSQEGRQSYIEDCEICCNPILVSFESSDQELTSFSIEKGYG